MYSRTGYVSLIWTVETKHVPECRCSLDFFFLQYLHTRAHAHVICVGNESLSLALFTPHMSLYTSPTVILYSAFGAPVF